MKKTRQNGVTLMTALLCLSVITIHLTANPVVQLTPFSLWHILIFLVNKSLVFAVPAFIFLSGLKLCSQYGQQQLNLKSFYIRRFEKVAIPYAVSFLIYFIYYYAKQWVSLPHLPEYLFLGTMVSHFYYIIIALQLYLLFPLLKRAVDRFPIATLALSLVSTVTFYAYIHPPYSDRFAGTYVFFFVFGMIWAKYNLTQKWNKYLWLFFILVLTIAVPHFTALYQSMYAGFPYAHGNLVTVFYATAAITLLFTLCTVLTEKWPGVTTLAQPLSRISFSVYLYHMLPILFLQYDLFPRFPLSSREQFLISCTVVYGLVFICAYLLPKIRKSA